MYHKSFHSIKEVRIFNFKYYEGLPKAMSTFIIQWNQDIHTKQMMSVKSGHLLLLSCKISIPVYAFLSALQNIKNASEVQVRSSSSQPALRVFLDCLVSLLVVTSQVIFQGPEKVVV